jgi:hypothetical protein
MIWDKAKSILENSPKGIGLIVLGIFLISIGGLSTALLSKFGLASVSGETYIEMGKFAFYIGVGVTITEGHGK